jgi:hypothetical protein
VSRPATPPSRHPTRDLPRPRQASSRRGCTVADDCFARPTGAGPASAPARKQPSERKRSDERYATNAIVRTSASPHPAEHGLRCGWPSGPGGRTIGRACHPCQGSTQARGRSLVRCARRSAQRGLVVRPGRRGGARPAGWAIPCGLGERVRAVGDDPAATFAVLPVGRRVSKPVSRPEVDDLRVERTRRSALSVTWTTPAASASGATELG